MSGFITIYNTDGEPVDEQLIHSLTHTLKFRGPDRKKVWIDGNIGMGHTLFKTTFEAEYENQPATIDNKVWITCSARIDDRENLVDKMGMKKDINLSLTPDSELILHAYRKWGEECLTHLLGDFAFVIWDKKKQKLFCARDRFGMRKLYYARKNNAIIICNTMGTMLKYPSITKELNKLAIGGFLLFGDHQWIDKSITAFKDIQSLAPASMMIIQQERIILKKYWDISFNLPLLRYKKASDYTDHFNEIFQTAVKDRIRTNSIVISMSGGMDSSTIAATVRKLEQDKTVTGLDLQAVTAVYDRIVPCQERYYSGIVAKHLNIPIHYVAGDDYPFIKPIFLTTRPLEINTYAFWKAIRKTIASNARVVLVGTSADNLLDYSPAVSTLREVNPLSVVADLYRLKKRYHKLPSLGTGLLSVFKQKSTQNVLMAPSSFHDWFNPTFAVNIGLKRIWEESWMWKPSSFHPRHPNAHHSLTELDWGEDDTIMESEFTLAEERDPFLDLRVVEFMFSIPSVPWFFKKHILRESMHGLLPKEIIDRPKTPLGYLSSKFIHEPSSAWIKEGKSISELSTFLDIDKIPLHDIQNLDPLSIDQALRAITLNEWLKNL